MHVVNDNDKFTANICRVQYNTICNRNVINNNYYVRCLIGAAMMMLYILVVTILSFARSTYVTILLLDFFFSSYCIINACITLLHLWIVQTNAKSQRDSMHVTYELT